MSNPILRVGPWYQFGNSINEPSQGDLNSTTTPVNLANVGWPNMSWRALAVKGVNEFLVSPDREQSYQVASLGETVESDEGYNASVDFEFHYQATSDFEMTFHWTDSGGNSGTGPTYFNDITWRYSTIEGDSDFLLETGGQSGSLTFTLPASSLGFARAGIFLVDPAISTCSGRLT